MNSSVLVELAIFLVINLYSQIGKRTVNFYRFILPIAVALFKGNQYFHTIPTGGSNLIAIFICMAAGILFGGLLVMTTKIGQDTTGKYYIQAGIPYFIVWVLSLGTRLGLAYYAEHNPAAVGQFFISHHLNPSIIGPAFIIMMITMLVVRIIGIIARIKLIPKKHLKAEESTFI